MPPSPRHLIPVALSLAFALACGGGEVDLSTPPGDAPGGGLGELLTAGVHFGSEVCTEKAGDNCANAATAFGADTPMLYFVHQTKDLPRLGQTYTIQWIAVDVGAAAPAGTVVAAVPATVSDAAMLAMSTHYTVSSEISKPNTGWPLGSYKVAVDLDGAPVAEAPFTIR